MQYAAAIKAGKHVFMEKPCCVDAPGFRMLMEANELADQKGLKVGVGLQRHHQASYVETIKRIHDGAIGRIMLLRAYWNGHGIWNRKREPNMTEMQYQVHNWYHFCWLSGDNICEQHVHNLDICNWVMQGALGGVKNAHPVEANGMGACLKRYRGEWKGTGQIFDEHFVEFTYADGTKMYSQCRQIPNTFSSVSEHAHGTEGESNCSGWIRGKQEWRFSGKGENPYVQEHRDLIAAIRSGEKYNEGWYGAISSMTAVLGRMATYSGQVVKWDDAVAKGGTEFPKELRWDAPAPVQKDAEGNYPIPMPGEYKAY
jgi:predicted dehydrogenase